MSLPARPTWMDTKAIMDLIELFALRNAIRCSQKDQNASESSRSPTFSFFSHANAKEYDINMMRYLAGWSLTHVTFLRAPHSYHNGEETVSAGSDRADAAPLQPEIPQNMQIRRHFPLTSNIHLALLPRVSRSFARSRHHTILD